METLSLLRLSRRRRDRLVGSGVLLGTVVDRVDEARMVVERSGVVVIRLVLVVVTGATVVWTATTPPSNRATSLARTGAPLAGQVAAVLPVW